MREHLNERSVALYRAHQLGGQELLELSDHIAMCELCAAQVTAGEDPDAPAAAIEDSLRSVASHLFFEELAAYVDGSASAAVSIRVEQHSEKCRECRRMLQDLNEEEQQLRRQVGQAAANRV